jgi:hypothetical protein
MASQKTEKALFAPVDDSSSLTSTSYVVSTISRFASCDALAARPSP